MAVFARLVPPVSHMIRTITISDTQDHKLLGIFRKQPGRLRSFVLDHSAQLRAAFSLTGLFVVLSHESLTSLRSWRSNDSFFFPTTRYPWSTIFGIT